MTLNRKPIQIVAIDLDYCTLTYATGACGAVLGTTGEDKCYNTFQTCQDTDNFDRGSQKLYMSMNMNGLPKEAIIYPCLSGPIDHNPMILNLGGMGESIGSLGKISRVRISALDFRDSGILVDKYQSERLTGAANASGDTHNPIKQGTFFGKLRARNPYYIGRSMQIMEGYEGDTLASMRVRHYIIDKWQGPDASGRVEIEGVNPLRLTWGDKAQVPIASQGRLESDITSSDLSATLSPPGIGNSEYPTSGKVFIGSEIMSFTRSGDTLTLSNRGSHGTDAEDHEDGDVVQLCAEWFRTPVNEVISSAKSTSIWLNGS